MQMTDVITIMTSLRYIYIYYAVYIGLSSTNTSKLQSILNAAARLIGGIAKFDHISYFIRDSLHWLPIRQRIQFKVCSLMRSCLAGSAPHYLRARSEERRVGKECRCGWWVDLGL